MPESTLPPVVALLPSYNAADFIEETLTSLLEQNYPNLEIMISDDCSSDQTVDVCRQLAIGDSRVNIQVQASNVGWVDNVNKLLQNAKGSYFFIAPHDDIFHPDYVKTLVEKLEQDKRAILAFADTDLLLYQGGTERRRYRQLEGLKSPILRGITILWRLGPWWIPYRGLVRRSALGQNTIHLNSAAGDFAADWPWLLGLGLRGMVIRVPEVLCQKHQTERSLSLSWNHTLTNWLKVTAVSLKVIDQSPLTTPAKSCLYCAALLTVPRHLVSVLVKHIRKLLD